jgi:uncharacterized protein YceK
MRKALIIAAIVALSGCATINYKPDPWTTHDTVLQGAFTALAVVDWMQTRSAAEMKTDQWGNIIGYRYRELNPVLGAHPTKSSIDTYFPVILLAHVGIAYLLPTGEQDAGKCETNYLDLYGWREVQKKKSKLNWRTIWQSVWIGVEAGYVHRNYQMGIRVGF